MKRQDAIFASNTATLSISGLAQVGARPAQFIGLHFFSPVDKMALLEVIVGRHTSAATLASVRYAPPALLRTMAQSGQTFYVVEHQAFGRAG